MVTRPCILKWQFVYSAKMYTVVHTFRDLQDSDYTYHEGDIYPREGVKATKKRIEELKGNKNRIGVSLIKAVKVKKDK